MRRLVLVPVAVVVFAVLSQAGLKTRLYVPLYARGAAPSRAQDAPAATSPTNHVGVSGLTESFDIASVKPNNSGEPGVSFRMQPGGRFSTTNAPVREIIRMAYQVQPSQIVTGALGPPPPGAQLPVIDPNAPSLFTALQEQLGLKLESTHGPVDVLVIDSVDHPSED